jgi:hypothetical protein
MCLLIRFAGMYFKLSVFEGAMECSRTEIKWKQKKNTVGAIKTNRKMVETEEYRHP